MGNMGYCRFRNTLEDLRDCYDNLDNNLTDKKDEARARVKLVELCQRIVNNADLDLFILEYDEAKTKFKEE